MYLFPEKTPQDNVSDDNKVPITGTVSSVLHSCSFISLELFTEVREEVTALAGIVWPIIITGFLLFSRSIISMLFLGRLGEAELAGGSLSIAFANITGYSVLKGLSAGMDPLCGQAFGAKQWVVLKHAFQKTLLLLLLFSVMIALLWINTEPILLRLGQDEGIVAVAEEYIVFSLPDLAAQAVLQPLNILLRAQCLTAPITFATAIAVAVHIPVSLLMVDYFSLGVRGVALASAFNTVNAALVLIVYISCSKKAIKPWTDISLGSFGEWRHLAALAVPSALSVCLEWWWYEVMMLMCGLLPNPRANVAAMGILIQTTGLIYVLPSSLGMGISTRVSNELGRSRPEKARRATRVGLTVSAGFGILALVFTLIVRNAWGELFTDKAEILRLTSTALPLVGLCELGNCPQTAGCGALRGSARPTVAANINFGAFYLVGLPVAIVAGFSMGFGFYGLWAGLLAAQASCAVIMLFAVGRTQWDFQVIRARMLTGAADEPKNDLEAGLLQ